MLIVTMRLSVTNGLLGITLIVFPMFLWTTLYQTLLLPIGINAVGASPLCNGPAADCAFSSTFHHFKLEQTQNKLYSDDGVQPLDDKYEQEVAKKHENVSRVLSINETTADARVAMEQTNKSSTSTHLDDVFLSVKTTHKYHEARLRIVVDTWFRLAPHQTYFFTDKDDQELIKKTGGHMVNTHCSDGHGRQDLCCKMSAEFDSFLKSSKKWFCHFDDDNYVNVPQLVKFLSQKSWKKDYYFGKPSIPHPLEIKIAANTRPVKFNFATGGAGFCISRALANRMSPYVSDMRLVTLCGKIILPDDVTIGYIIENKCQVNLTRINEFHSHLEPLRNINPRTLRDQLTFSYGLSDPRPNIVPVPEPVLPNDPTRFMTIHCILYPESEVCKKT
ncbi:PREDICTED: beta-1,3-N-acetylglucosaminyltransferase lunatic fringe-like [Priapulus caudatus]|uniref:Beta-1,3-N-acetylglucosaminyltransferase lunatic fringe-like n=1 Tax=Priapulus caudatus TaxID=37621 RepID=A0ABM1ES06_PRICU|nr:PREDICTED: beta-1,3-N-acetylglucosaminyltransferase lunatic fringe-like [Priapulus caudatus]